MLFTKIMGKTRILLYGFLALLVFIFWIFSDSKQESEDFAERVKISLRDVGNSLLLTNSDSTSLVLPVIEFEELKKYRLSFENPLAIHPDSLVAITRNSFTKSAMPSQYRVEVLQCEDGEVAYSYEISEAEENTIIPCSGRFLPSNCYTIEVQFIHSNPNLFASNVFVYLLIFIGFVFLIDYRFHKRKSDTVAIDSNEVNAYATIGTFRFYEEQNKLVKAAKEISLSKKECELLAIFVANPNQIIKRDELLKRVWEDNGVFVGRSLDTYISKLRKKLQDDDSVNLINVHGIGYKLEVRNNN